MDSLKTSSNDELIKLIEKHGADDAIDIVNLARLTNKPLNEVGRSSDSAFTTSVHKIITGLSDIHYGLTGPKYEVLKFWASRLGAGELEFLTTHAHTILDNRPDSDSEYDARFVGDTVSCIKSRFARSGKKLADWTSEGYARILADTHELRMYQAILRMELMCEYYQDSALFEDSALFDRLNRKCFMEEPHIGRAPNAQMRISGVEFDKHFLNKCIRICDEYIQAGNEWQAATDTSEFLDECIHKCDEQLQILKEQ